MKLDSIPQGRPSWVDLMTTDVPAAIQFYGSLFGWNDEAAPIAGGGTYHNESKDGALVAGIGDLDVDQRQQGVPSHWNVYFAVGNAESAVGRVEAAGGQVIMPPVDVMGLGEMAVLLDPTGAAIGLWQAKQHQGFGAIQEPGTISWCELTTDDPERAARFYTEVLGISSQPMPMGDGQEPYTLIGPPNNEGAGILKKTPDMGDMPNVWGVYFEVDDCDAAMARAAELGGSAVTEAMEVSVGRFAILADPQGAVFGVIKSSAA